MAKDKDKADQLDAIELAAENATLKKQVAELTEKLRDTGHVAPVNVKGFFLAVDDPFGMGAVRAYRKAGGKSPQFDGLPFVLPDKDAATKAALESYVVRALGAADKVRAKAAQEKLKVLG